MQPRHLFTVLAIVGAVVPFTQLVPWLMVNGLAPAALVAELFSTRIGAFFGLDVVMSAFALFAFIAIDTSRHRVQRWWLPVVGTLCVGVSFGLPLYLALREPSVAGPSA